jgi:hypothetical protein
MGASSMSGPNSMQLAQADIHYDPASGRFIIFASVGQRAEERNRE